MKPNRYLHRSFSQNIIMIGAIRRPHQEAVTYLCLPIYWSRYQRPRPTSAALMNKLLLPITTATSKASYMRARGNGPPNNAHMREVKLSNFPQMRDFVGLGLKFLQF